MYAARFVTCMSMQFRNTLKLSLISEGMRAPRRQVQVQAPQQPLLLFPAHECMHRSVLSTTLQARTCMLVTGSMCVGAWVCASPTHSNRWAEPNHADKFPVVHFFKDGRTDCASQHTAGDGARTAVSGVAAGAAKPKRVHWAKSSARSMSWGRVRPALVMSW